MPKEDAIEVEGTVVEPLPIWRVPAEMVVGAVPMFESKVEILGACCGSTPEHIAAFRKALDAYQK